MGVMSSGQLDLATFDGDVTLYGVMLIHYYLV